MPKADETTPALRDLEARIGLLESALRDKGAVEARLQESEERLALVLRGANDGWWDWDLTSGKLFFSPRWWAILGYGPSDMPSTEGVWKALAHPDDQERVNHAYRDALESSASRFEVESRRLHKEGHWVPVLTRGHITRDGSGTPVRISGTSTDLTEQRRAEEALRESEQRFRSMVETTIAGVLAIDCDGRTRFVNARMAEMLGYDPAEMLGQRFEDLLLPEDLLAHQERMDLRRAGRRETYERRFRHKSGGVVWTIVSATPLLSDTGEFNGSFATFTDITERKRDEEHLRRLAEMLDEAPNSITVHDTQGRFLYANRRTFEIHGYDEREFMALNLRDVDVPASAALIVARMRLIDQHGEATFEVAHFRKDRTTFPLEVFVRQVNWAGRPALLSIATDITERKQAEAALAEQVQELQRWYAATLGREKRISELKREVNELSRTLGIAPPYAAVGNGKSPDKP